jgi:polyhydroxybutyrate depolymerase
MMPSSGCGVEPAAAGSATMQVGGMERQYVVALPQAYDKSRPYPLILAFHGAGLSGPQFRNFFNLVTPVGADGIVVYPTGLGGQWDVRRDLPFVDALRMKLESSYCIDAQRVFATGHSNGAFFTNAIGCQRGDVLRAIAPMSGGQQQQASACKGAPAVWISHGATDNIVATSYGRQTRDFWVKRNECDASMSMPVMPSPCLEYQGCTAGAPVRYCEYPGDHNLMANSAQSIWAFFKQF